MATTTNKVNSAQMLTVKQRKIVILSDDDSFASQICARWQAERITPTFTLLKGDSARVLAIESLDLAVIDLPRADAHRVARRACELSSKPLILVCGDAETLQSVRDESPRSLAVMRSGNWPDFVVVLALEVLRRIDVTHRANHAEQVSALLKCHATLGQYVIEMRHSLNNALTGVLGNSELLLLEPGAFSAGVRAQIDTIRNMALRMHEILQRFSSLEKELTFVEQQSLKEQNQKPQMAAASS
jgi:signal transduction histidine kinase